MSKKLRVIYITGLGNTDKRGQRLVIKLWRLYGVEPVFCDMRWGDDEVWSTKFERLLKVIDTAASEDKRVALVGVSAGASAAINAYALRQKKIDGVILIAGKINYPERISPAYRRKNPVFVDSVYAASESLKLLKPAARQRIMSIYGLKDSIVQKENSILPGAINKIVPTVGHGLTIASQITLGAPSLIHFLKRQAKIK